MPLGSLGLLARQFYLVWTAVLESLLVIAALRVARLVRVSCSFSVGGRFGVCVNRLLRYQELIQPESLFFSIHCCASGGRSGVPFWSLLRFGRLVWCVSLAHFPWAVVLVSVSIDCCAIRN